MWLGVVIVFGGLIVVAMIDLWFVRPGLDLIKKAKKKEPRKWK